VTSQKARAGFGGVVHGVKIRKLSIRKNVLYFLVLYRLVSFHLTAEIIIAHHAKGTEVNLRLIERMVPELAHDFVNFNPLPVCPDYT
jgi:(2Fe-2S) ferredoxin